MNTRAATAGNAQAAAGNGLVARLVTRAWTCSMTTTANTAPIQIQAFVAVTAASAASSAASRMRRWTAARAAPTRRAVSNGSTTAEPEGDRNSGMSTSMIAGMRPLRTGGG